MTSRAKSGLTRGVATVSPGIDDRTGFVPVTDGSLFDRDIGRGRPILILHGGPDFGHNYLLPEMDRLASSFRLIY